MYLKRNHLVYNSGSFQLDGIPDGDKEKVAEFVSREFLEGKRIKNKLYKNGPLHSYRSSYVSIF